MGRKSDIWRRLLDGRKRVRRLSSPRADQNHSRRMERTSLLAEPNHRDRVGGSSTLSTVNNLGLLYKNQGKMVDAEEMYQRALRGYEKAVGNGHPRKQKIARNLQNLQ